MLRAAKEERAKERHVPKEHLAKENLAKRACAKRACAKREFGKREFGKSEFYKSTSGQMLEVGYSVEDEPAGAEASVVTWQGSIGLPWAAGTQILLTVPCSTPSKREMKPRSITSGNRGNGLDSIEGRSKGGGSLGLDECADCTTDLFRVDCEYTVLDGC